MTATSTTILSVGATESLNSKLNSFFLSKSTSLRINSHETLHSLCCHKADSSLHFDLESSFLGKQSRAALLHHLAPTAQKVNSNAHKNLQHNLKPLTKLLFLELPEE
uniref:Uncharacterized protein n=1 Tax=Cucumis sativus TaxID=3659 RepID=A0A0A0KGB0_CUCSA